jgi:hypothetical protein
VLLEQASHFNDFIINISIPYIVGNYPYTCIINISFHFSCLH